MRGIPIFLCLSASTVRLQEKRKSFRQRSCSTCAGHHDFSLFICLDCSVTREAKIIQTKKLFDFLWGITIFLCLSASTVRLQDKRKSSRQRSCSTFCGASRFFFVYLPRLFGYKTSENLADKEAVRLFVGHPDFSLFICLDCSVTRQRNLHPCNTLHEHTYARDKPGWKKESENNKKF